MRFRVVLPASSLPLTVLLLATIAGCSSSTPQANLSPTPVVATTTAPASTAVTPTKAAETAPAKKASTSAQTAKTAQKAKSFDNRVLEQAADKAASAASIAQSAQSQDDWSLAATRWQQAIVLLKSVPANHPKKVVAQKSIAEYQSKLTNAQKRAKNGAAVIANDASGQIIVDKPALAAGTTNSKQSAEMMLAMHLRKTGAKMYGTYWCTTCQWQQEQFGDAFKQVSYVECDPAGQNPRPDVCDRSGIRAYPTWEVNGQLVRPGAFSLDRLADLSGYSGPRDFGS
jgi:hypothetical protein